MKKPRPWSAISPPTSATLSNCRAEPQADPIAYFLFERKRGHCEYFASSMAVMLRAVGIPSRVVTGFRGGEFNDLTGSYIIRARDAHAWVEAYIPEPGMARLRSDPGRRCSADALEQVAALP